jgi:uncharacterized membrane protein
MGKSRLEAFSDGVIAILITIMVLDLKIPQGDRFDSLGDLAPVLLSYALSFVYLGIYWNNHHHMLHTVSRISGAILWANLNFLFWLSLVPFTTAWMSTYHASSVPAAIYGAVLLLSAVAYFILQALIIRSQGAGSLLRRAIGADWKGRMSSVLYISGIIIAFWSPRVSQASYVLVALMWLIPDRRIERQLQLSGD